MDHVAEDAAVPVDLVEVDLLDEIEAQFVANDLTCDQDNGRTIAIGLVYPVDEMQTAGAATAGDCRQAICYLCLCLRSERSRLFMSHRHPLDFALFERAGDEVERVAHHAVTMLDACILQGFNNDVRDSLPIAFKPCCDPILPQHAPNRGRRACTGMRELESACVDSAWCSNVTL